ncbi:PQQ-binding-like beta-propeller repeat protein, partial [Streptomyces sp. PU-14G]|uniref:outer membrane protein assembly factor BamB family protein n=1 Tax=Streptomyces sp. PU-14G TaxID=2800808 RepID=UPI0034E0394A
RGSAAALKVLRPELAYDPDMARRFVREAEAASAVRGKGVARVLGAQTEGGRPWIASEFLAGPTLQEAVERHGRFEEAGVRALGAALGRTLHEIHSAGLVHRDLKPANIVLTSRGPRVIDFGIARPEHGLTLTTTGQVPVTPGYGPPEQVLGQRVGPAADVFALGAVLTFAATGERAFTGEHVAAVSYEVVHGQPRLAGLPHALLPLVAPCLDKNAARRPTPEDVARAFAPPKGADLAWRRGPLAGEIAEREQTAARMTTLPAAGEPDGAGAGAVRPSRRRLLAGLAGGGVVVAVGGGAGAWYLLGRDEEDPHEWDAEPLAKYEPGKPPSPLWGPFEVAREGAPAPVPLRDVAVVAAKGGGLHAFDVRNGGRRWKARLSVGSGPLLVTGAEEPVLLAADRSGEVVGLGADGKDRWSASADAAVLLATDSEAVYLTTKSNKLRAVSLTTHKPRWTTRLPVESSAEHPARAVVTNGRLVVHGADGKVACVDTGTGRAVWGPRKQSAEGTALTPAAGRDAEGLVYLGGRRLTALSMADGSQKWVQPAAEDSGWGAPAVRGKVLYAANAADVEARRTADGTGTWTVTLQTTTLPLDPPTIQRNTAWVAMYDDGSHGVTAVDTRKGAQAWTYIQGASGPWRFGAGGNRVFLLQGGVLTAMPVV